MNWIRKKSNAVNWKDACNKPLVDIWFELVVEGEELEDQVLTQETIEFNVCPLYQQIVKQFWSALLLVMFALITQLSSLGTKERI